MKTAQEKFEEIVATIEHWLRVYNGDDKIGASGCPLCVKYNNRVPYCRECPIFAKSGETECKNTPYTAVFKHFDKHESLKRKLYCSTCDEVIGNELEYLNDILFDIIKDQEIVLTRQFTEEDDKLCNAFVIDVSREIGKTFTIENRSDISWRGNIKTPSGWVPARCFKIYTPIANPAKYEQKKCSITYKQIIVRGEKYVEITGIYGFKNFDDLPESYTKLQESVYMSEYISYLYDYSGSTILRFGNKYSISEYNQILDVLRIAAKKLHEINKTLKIENADWDGVEKTDYI